MDALRNAISSNTALLALSIVLLVVAFALSLVDISAALTILLAVVGMVFLVVWFVHSRLSA